MPVAVGSEGSARAGCFGAAAVVAFTRRVIRWRAGDRDDGAAGVAIAQVLVTGVAADAVIN